MTHVCMKKGHCTDKNRSRNLEKKEVEMFSKNEMDNG